MLSYHACRFHPSHRLSLPWDWEAGRTLKGPVLILGVRSSHDNTAQSSLLDFIAAHTVCFAFPWSFWTDLLVLYITPSSWLTVLYTLGAHQYGSTPMQLRNVFILFLSFLLSYIFCSLWKSDNSVSVFHMYDLFFSYFFSLFYYPVYLFIRTLPAMSSTWLSNLLF